MPAPRLLIEWNEQFLSEKEPIQKDDVDFMGIKREKILDFGPIGTRLVDIPRFRVLNRRYTLLPLHTPGRQ